MSQKSSLLFVHCHSEHKKKRVKQDLVPDGILMNEVQHIVTYSQRVVCNYFTLNMSELQMSIIPNNWGSAHQGQLCLRQLLIINLGVMHTLLPSCTYGSS